MCFSFVTKLQTAHGRLPIGRLGAVLSCLVLMLTGCENVPSTLTPLPVSANSTDGTKSPETLVLREGDELRIAFPGAPNLDTTQRVRPDGRVTLAMVGEVVASGLTPSDLEKKLLDLYSTQLVSKEVSVTVISSTFTVYVSGAVLRPGKVIADHPLSALEAIMEAGGFDEAKADMQSVRIVRTEDGVTKNYVVNLKAVLEGGQSNIVYLKRSDIVRVPEKFSWF